MWKPFETALGRSVVGQKDQGKGELKEREKREGPPDPTEGLDRPKSHHY